MRLGRRKGVDGFLLFGAGAILIGVVAYPVANWLLDRNTDAQFCVVCIAVGLLAGVTGLGRMMGWSK